MLEAIAADLLHQALQPRNMSDGAIAKGVERIVRELALSDISADAAIRVSRRNSAKSQRSGRCSALQSAVSVFYSKNTAENWRIGDFDVWQEALCPVTAMKQNAFVFIVGVVVIPIH